MLRVVRPLAVFSVASVMSLAALLQMFIGVDGAHGSDGRRPGIERSFGSYTHDLTRMRLLEKTLYHVEESYVEPRRIDWERMFVEAVEAVEASVPAVMFHRDADSRMLAAGIHDFNTVLEIDPVSDRKTLLERLKEVGQLLHEHLEPGDIPLDDPQVEPMASIEYAMINGLLSTLDPHSVLLPPPDANQMDLENQGEFGGMGITIVLDRSCLRIDAVQEGNPAQQAGLKADDCIVRIDGESTINMSLDEAVRLLRGPVGAPITLEIRRGDLREPMQFDIVRQVIKLNRVQGDLLDGDVGYIQIQSFHQQVERDLHDELARLHRLSSEGGLRGLILDMRDNPGGYLNQAVRVADAFLTQGTIVATVDGTGQRRDEETATQSAEPMYPMVVLVDASSASASEIVAGALRNNERAVIVGERTFGKGSVQNLHPLVDESKLKITISRYLTPGDRSIQSVGIPADIELRPMIVRKASEDGVFSRDLAMLFHRERVRREVDLDMHLDAEALRVEEPAYVVPYLRTEVRRNRTVEAIREDPEVRFARDLLLASPSWRRSEMLVAANAVVRKAQGAGNQQVVEALAELGIDWSPGRPWMRGAQSEQVPLELRLDLGPDEVLRVGQEQRIGVEITNRGSEPIFRVAAVAKDHEIFEGTEFIFGRIDPGETRRWEHPLTLTDGFPSERMPVTFELRDMGAGVLATRRVEIPVAGRPLPRLEWSWAVQDRGTGDGDGVASLGETLEIQYTVRNVGSGPTAAAFARIKNRAGRALDIVRGTLTPGTVVDAEGRPCEPEAPGIDSGQVLGDPEHERVVAGLEPLWPEACKRILAPGQTWTGSFEVTLKESRPDGQYELELVTGDTEAYDYASVVRSGFHGFQFQEDRIILSEGGVLPEAPMRKPPAIEVSRAPSQVVEGARVTVSGVVEDDKGLAHVMVFASEDKVFYQGSGRTQNLKRIPFTAEVLLAEGANTITVLATDVDGFTHTQSVVTWYDKPEVARVDER